MTVVVIEAGLAVYDRSVFSVYFFHLGLIFESKQDILNGK